MDREKGENNKMKKTTTRQNINIGNIEKLEI